MIFKMLGSDLIEVFFLFFYLTNKVSDFEIVFPGQPDVPSDLIRCQPS